MRSFVLRLLSVAFAALAVGAAPSGGRPALARDDGDRSERGGRGGDLARIDRELKEQRALLQQVARSEQEHYESVRRLLERQSGAVPETSTGAPPAARDGSATADVPAAPSPRPPALTLAHVTGRVAIGGAPPEDVYVYLEGFRSTGGRNATLEISQAGKQFVPRFAVALLGTRVSFPNRDTFFHNVFSPAPVPFDLGTYRADQEAPTVLLRTPGVVEIFCNIHAQMSAQILVVPNRVFAKVNADGTFRLDKVPVGRRKLVAWGPGLRPQRLELVVPATGAEAAFTLEPELALRHKNKFGQPYGSYKE
jgi:plastocyanin